MTRGRRMSVALTIEAVRARRKTVTRRQIDTWAHLKVGDRLVLVEKGQGIPKGEHQVIVAVAEVVAITEERLSAITPDEIRREAVPSSHDWTPADFAAFWLASHGYTPDADPLVRRIEWRYLDEPEVES